MGAYISAAGGHLLGELAPTIAIVFTIIFSYLAIDELLSWRNGDLESSITISKQLDGILDAVRLDTDDTK